MLQAGQRLRLGPGDRRDFQDHGPAGKIRLFGKVYTGKSPVSQRQAKPKAEEFLASLGNPRPTIVASSLGVEQADESLTADELLQS